MAAQKKYPDELREIRRIWGNYGLCREFCDVLRIVRCLGALLLAACAENVTIWDSCGVPA